MEIVQKEGRPYSPVVFSPAWKAMGLQTWAKKDQSEDSTKAQGMERGVRERIRRKQDSALIKGPVTSPRPLSVFLGNDDCCRPKNFLLFDEQRLELVLCPSSFTWPWFSRGKGYSKQLTKLVHTFSEQAEPILKT